MKLLKIIFTWWAGTTIGTWFYTCLKGSLVGKDSLGNRYYQSKDGRRWVIFAGEAEASAICASWHGWIHHTEQNPPEDNPLSYKWQKPHLPNQTGTKNAHHPKYNPLDQSKKDIPSYQSWQPK
ncbi:MAG: NADH:ubiquinone oxidoreductase subunit NDUFA12 [Parvibaculales bacterium]